MGIKQKILKLIDDYYSSNQKNPTELYLTPSEESELTLLSECDAINGPRATFPKLFGLTVHWDANKFEVK